ncbi:MAG: tetratricopeptide repeat protein [Thermodesulfobacteriota bacterium]
MTTNELFHEAQDFFVEGQYPESIKAFTKAHEEGYDPVRSYLSRGVAFLKNQQPEMAIDDFSAVVALDPDNDRAYYYRGIAHIGKREYEDALDDLTHSIAINPGRGVAYFARAIVESEFGCEEDALRDFQAAVAHSDRETAAFAHTFGNTHTLFDRSMALLEGERGPLSIVLTDEEVAKLEKWMEH